MPCARVQPKIESCPQPMRPYRVSGRPSIGRPERKRHGYRSRASSAARRRRGLREPRRGRWRSAPCGGAQDPARHRSRRGRDAAGAARHLARPSAAPRPGALRRLVVPAPRARLLRRGTPNPPMDAEPATASARRAEQADGTSAVVDRDQLERGFRRLPSTIARWWSCTTTSTCRSTRSPRRSASRPGRSDLDFITRCAACARRSTPTPGRRRGRQPDEHRSRHDAHRSSWLERASTCSRTVSWTPSSTSSLRPHSAAPVAGAEVFIHEQHTRVAVATTTDPLVVTLVGYSSEGQEGITSAGRADHHGSPGRPDPCTTLAPTPSPSATRTSGRVSARRRNGDQQALNGLRRSAAT